MIKRFRKIVAKLKRSLAPKHLSYILTSKVLGRTYTYKRATLASSKPERLAVPANARITYVRDGMRRPLVCLAYSVSKHDEMYIVSIGYSLCDEQYDQCSKLEGRNKAIERLLSAKEHFVRLVLPVEDVSTKETKIGPQPAREEIVEYLARKSNSHSKLSKKVSNLLAARKRAEQLAEEKATVEAAKKVLADALGHF